MKQPYKETLSDRLGKEQFARLTQDYQVKNWKRAERKAAQHQQIQNYRIEMLYKEILGVAKTYEQDLDEVVYGVPYEKDFRENSDDIGMMHLYITPHFYWYLNCDTDLNYRIGYDFFHSPYAFLIRPQLERITEFGDHLRHSPRLPNCTAYYDVVVRKAGWTSDSEFF